MKKETLILLTILAMLTTSACGALEGDVTTVTNGQGEEVITPIPSGFIPSDDGLVTNNPTSVPDLIADVPLSEAEKREVYRGAL